MRFYIVVLPILVFSLFGAGCTGIALSSSPATSKPKRMNQSIRKPTQSEDAVKNVINQELPPEPTLNEFILFALKNSSALKAAYLQYEAACLKAPQVSTLPDPVLSYGYFIQEVETRVGPQQHKVGVMQSIPWFGKLSLKESIANEEAQAALYAFLSKKNELVAKITESYFELAYLERAKAVTEANFELLKRWEQVVNQRYRSQVGTQADLIKVQVELGEVEDKLQELSQLGDPLTADFNALLNRESRAPVVIRDTVLTDTPLDFSSTSVLSQEMLEKKLPQSNPELRLLDALLNAKEDGVNLAHKNFYPDFGIGADYVFVGDRGSAGTESGDDALVGMFSITLPLYRSKYSAGLLQAEKESNATQAMRVAKFHELSGRLARTLFDIKDSKRRVSLYRDTLVPKANESLESTYTAFESGESTFLELLDTERSILGFELSLARAQADLHISDAKLRSLLGDFSKEQTPGFDNRGMKQ